jgi:alpha-methylacyl-CoA racemase
MAEHEEHQMKSESGPLTGIRVLEIESIGPGPFTGMILADLGANVLRIRRPAPTPRRLNPVLDRGRAGFVTADLKSEAGREQVLALVAQADALIEGFRPGVMERLGLGPDTCLARNPRLVYGRVTGWGRSGPLAQTAGHDINYIAVSGALHSMGTAESGPMPPLNLVGDYGGGGLLLALGIVSALLESSRSGKGQIVDAAMVDGAAMLMGPLYGLKSVDGWSADRASNFLDGSCWYYTVYPCRDGWVSVGPLELEFRRILLERLGLGHEVDALLHASPGDPVPRARLTAIFASRTRSEWSAIFEGTDACVASVLSMDEASFHPHVQERNTLRLIEGVVHPAPAPRFSRTQNPEPRPARETRDELLSGWGRKRIDSEDFQ